MLNILKKIITVIFTLIIMINYCNGFIPYTEVLSDINKFTKEKINNCEEFTQESSKYLVNYFQYFVDSRNNYYVISYEASKHRDTFSPFMLYRVENSEELGDFKHCSENIIYFEINGKLSKFELKDIVFLKPVNSFVQPPELIDADKISAIDNCDDFDKNVIQVNTSGFLVYKDNLSGNFHRLCMYNGCDLHYYLYSSEERPKPKSFMKFFGKPEHFGFFWSEKLLNGEEHPKIIYHTCHNGKLRFLSYKKNDDTDKSGYQNLYNLTFYNIRSKTKSLKQVESHLNDTLSTCNEFNGYLKNPMNILDDYIYFSDTRDETKPINYAMKVNLYGPENLRERPYLLEYKSINPLHKGYAPHSESWLFVSCQSPSRHSSLIKDSLVFEQDKDPRNTYLIPLDHLQFYSKKTISDEGSGIEMQELKSITTDSN